MFEGIIGNDLVKQYLIRMVNNKSIGNSLLFAGPDGIGKSLFAKELAFHLLESTDDTHPDFHVYKPEGKIGMHSIGSMRQFSEDVFLAPYEAKWKIFIIHDADRMLSYSANALLKTFEEPSLGSIIILLSSSPATLLPTVLSRCRTIHFQSIPEEEIASFLHQKRNCTMEQASKLASQSQGSLGIAVRLLSQGVDQLREMVKGILAGGRFAGYKQLGEAASEIARLVDESKGLLDKAIREETISYTENLTAVQRESLEKEIDGAIAMRQVAIAHDLFKEIIWWYRDLELLRTNGDPVYIYHKDSLSALNQAIQYQDKQGPTIEEVNHAIKDVKLSLERSTSLNICLENLFLRLNFL